MELNRAVVEHDKIILIGGVSFHYFAGFTGGRKLICPGLASSRTITGTHKLAFDFNAMSRREGVETGVINGNAVHNALVEAVAKVQPDFVISTIVDGDGGIVDLYCGDWLSSHQAACDAYSGKNILEIEEKRDLIVVSCGGFPHDINLIQAHKALESASKACNDGGTILIFAECGDGLGRDDFLKWFDATNSSDLAEKLCEKYQVNGQTAWSLLQKAERFKIKIVTSLTEAQIASTRLELVKNISSIASESTEAGYIIPNGGKVLIRVANPT